MGIREGCSPGYWGRPQHLNSWAPTEYSTDDIFNTVFNRNALDSSTTLLQAINPSTPMTLLKQLARQAVAALLNATHPAINYSLTESQVIKMFQDAFDSGEFEKTKDEFDAYNNLFCPL
ncbi:FMN phosphatase YigB (HAD superfamily) [Desulfitispora alkaliphila]|uniref:hypothetical protein n=1 Tax=Desulfitispora alkaliphila TaxID=622674 RepID=UPI003D1F5A98